MNALVLPWIGVRWLSGGPMVVWLKLLNLDAVFLQVDIL